MAKDYKLGPLPWSRETLNEAYWSNWVQAFENIKEHPGFAAQEGFDNVQRTLDVFLDNCDDLLTAIKHFKIQVVQQPNFFWRSNRLTVEQSEHKLRKHVFSTTSSAFALVDASRRISGKFPVDGYEERKNSAFVDNELHLFIQGLRNFFSHKYLLTPAWQILLTKGSETTQLVLKKEQLLKFDDWKPLARIFIERSRFGIDVEAAITDYRKLVDDFHKWYGASFKGAYGSRIDEYVSYERILKGEGWKNTWKQILSHGINNKLDPYAYLDRYLTPDEIKKALAVRNYSKEQVDLMISMADEYEICDDEIRELVYKLFHLAAKSKIQKEAALVSRLGVVLAIGICVVALVRFIGHKRRSRCFPKMNVNEGLEV